MFALFYWLSDAKGGGVLIAPQKSRFDAKSSTWVGLHPLLKQAVGGFALQALLGQCVSTCGSAWNLCVPPWADMDGKVFLGLWATFQPFHQSVLFSEQMHGVAVWEYVSRLSATALVCTDHTSHSSGAVCEPWSPSMASPAQPQICSMLHARVLHGATSSTMNSSPFSARTPTDSCECFMLQRRNCWAVPGL